ncbi:hypothetical protein EW145_g3128 [Phellinidium pouzarii]|uniref:FAD-binding domain-containing protein n=1 Tax=Phellinidium pouzarii TaxID=167371 RepID=A0A4S4LA71_9AGAM|nr:hypothetical protein EW145_g3128 [Phellinidium pouzarii]
MQPQVLIVGAGPTGLVAALTLLKSGVSVRIVEKDATYHPSSRGPGVQPRIQEIEHFLGTLPEVKALSAPVPTILNYYDPENPHRILRSTRMFEKIEATPAFPIKEPLITSQYLHERILREHVTALGARIELSTELSHIEQDENSVTVKLIKNVGGKQEEESAIFSYVIGADGGHSSVRRLIGLHFLGETHEKDQLMNADVDLKGIEGNGNGVHIFGDQKGFFVYFMSTNVLERYQLLIGGPKYEGIASECDAAGLDDLQAIVVKITGRSDLQLTQIHSKSNWRFNVRMVDHFQKGRVFVAGDAAHVHSPMGGQGLNSGIQDSFNLAWKLALVISGSASPALLASYEEERLPVIGDMLFETTKLHRKVFVDKGDQGAVQGIQDTMDILKQAAAPLTVSSPADEKTGQGNPFFRRRKLFQLELNYRWSPIVLDERFEGSDSAAPKDTFGEVGNDVRAGDRAPDAPGLVVLSKGTAAKKVGKVKGEQGESVRLFDIFDPTVHTVLVFSSNARLRRDLHSILQKLPACLVRTLAIVPAAFHPTRDEDFMLNADLVLEDKEGHAVRGYGVDDSVYTVVVRPDGMVGAFAKGPGGVERYFTKLLGST